MAENPKAVSDTLRRANLANIAKKLHSGRTLTKTEQEALDESESGEDLGRRMGKKKLAKELGITRATLDDYLNRPDAPKSDAEKTYVVEDVRAYIAANCPKAMNTPEVRRMREAKLRLELEEMEHDMRVKRGQYIDKSRIAGVFTIVNSTLTAKMREVFEKEIPPRLEGRTQVERAVILADGVDRVLKSLKADMERYAAAA